MPGQVPVGARAGDVSCRYGNRPLRPTKLTPSSLPCQGCFGERQMAWSVGPRRSPAVLTRAVSGGAPAASGSYIASARQVAARGQERQ
jgi:hypothetical protein